MSTAFFMKNRVFLYRLSERTFCLHLIKKKKIGKKSKFVLTFWKSKICKKLTKLLQKNGIVWYNDYTIKTERDDLHEIHYCWQKH